MKTDILFIGALDYPNIPRHGDSVKNQHLIDYFQKYRTVEYIDTWGWKKRLSCSCTTEAIRLLKLTKE